MKKIITFFAILLFQNSSIAQQMVQSINDLHKLKDNEQLFVNKPLKYLLKEIKPEIKTGTVINNDFTFVFCFRFTTFRQQQKKEGSASERVSLLVYVSEFVPWYWIQRPRGNQIVWTQNDAHEYGDSTVIHIEIIPASPHSET